MTQGWRVKAICFLVLNKEVSFFVFATQGSSRGMIFSDFLFFSFSLTKGINTNFDSQPIVTRARLVKSELRTKNNYRFLNNRNRRWNPYEVWLSLTAKLARSRNQIEFCFSFAICFYTKSEIRFEGVILFISETTFSCTFFLVLLVCQLLLTLNKLNFNFLHVLIPIAHTLSITRSSLQL